MFVPRLVPAGGLPDEWPEELESRPRLRRFLEHNGDEFFQDLTKQDHDVLKALVAAALRDIGGRDRERIALGEVPYVKFISERDLDHDGRVPHNVKKRRFTRGRQLWSQLAAWPWCCWPNGKPPSRWHQRGDPATASRLQRWLDDDIGLDFGGAAA
jgi:hypothetical protein